ncbi:MAG: hypothetical protein GY915_01860 [bacterium]|nr:hypothetical protein [bacterium]
MKSTSLGAIGQPLKQDSEFAIFLKNALQKLKEIALWGWSRNFLLLNL